MAKKILDGAELAAYVKNRQAKQVRMLRQAHKIIPKLVVIKSSHASTVINSYVTLKEEYAKDILVDFETVACEQSEMPAAIQAANIDRDVHAIVVQLPLDIPKETDDIVNLITPKKDVDGLGSQSKFVSATAEAIDWLLSGHSIELEGKRIAIVGKGRLVGAPLIALWKSRGLDVTGVDKKTSSADEIIRTSDVIVTATGKPGRITSDLVNKNAVVVDAGTASESGKIVGDIEPSLIERDDLVITPRKGGVGPLTIVLMFDHVIRAALEAIPSKS